MDILEVLFYVIGFFVLYGVSVSVFYLIDLGLRKWFGKGIVPKDYWS